MKQVLLICTLFILFSCNDTGDGKKPVPTDNSSKPVPVKEPADTQSAVPDPELKPEQKTEPAAASANSCTRMIFFQPGAEVVSESYGQDGKANSRQHTRVRSVEEKGGYTIAHVTGTTSDIGEKGKVTALDYEYKCDGKQIYFDFSSMFRTKDKQSNASFVSTLISFPINVKAGQQLPDDSGSMTSQRGDRKMVMKYTFKDRKVSAQEELVTPAGKWKCYKISNTVHIDIDIPGMDEKAKAMMKQMQAFARTSSTIWFDPDFGIVKMEMYMNDLLMTKNEVIAVKK